MTVAQAHSGTVLLDCFKRKASHFSRARQVNLDLLLQFGQVPALVKIRNGQVAQILEMTIPLQSSDFSIRGTEQGWTKFWNKVPEPGWHDILALAKRKEFCIEGNLQPLMANLQFIKDLLSASRGGLA